MRRPSKANKHPEHKTEVEDHNALVRSSKSRLQNIRARTISFFVLARATFSPSLARPGECPAVTKSLRNFDIPAHLAETLLRVSTRSILFTTTMIA
jgi:hypothetical protein